MKSQTLAVSTTIVAVPVEKALFVQNTGTPIIYLGGSDVTADTDATGGVQLAKGEKLQVDRFHDLYAIAGTGGSTLAILGG